MAVETDSPAHAPAAADAPFVRIDAVVPALERLRGWLTSAEFLEPARAFVLSRLLFAGLTYFGVILFNSALHDPTHPSFLHQLLPAWGNPVNHGWDTAWYIEIAQRGYHWNKAVGTSPAAFFPLYPLLLHVGAAASHRSYLVVALTVSNLAFLGALVYLWKLARWETDHASARRTLLYVSVFPSALFFFAGYTESLFLWLTVASFWHIRRHDWLSAGIFGGLASATRVTGVLLLLPLLYEYGRSCNFSWREIRWRGPAAMALVPSGLLAFMVYLSVNVGDALAFRHDQAAWQKVSTWKLWTGVVESLRQLLIVQPWASFFEAHNLINFGLGAAFFLCSVLLARRLPPAHTLYLLGFWVVTLSEPAVALGYPVPFVSMARYVLSLFPVFIFLGVIGRNRSFHDGYLVLSTALLSILTLQFILGRWIV